jgi:hypothetical protein
MSSVCDSARHCQLCCKNAVHLSYEAYSLVSQQEVGQVRAILCAVNILLSNKDVLRLQHSQYNQETM